MTKTKNTYAVVILPSVGQQDTHSMGKTFKTRAEAMKSLRYYERTSLGRQFIVVCLIAR